MFTQRYCQKFISISKFSRIFFKSSPFLLQKDFVNRSIYQKDLYMESIFPLHQTLQSFCTAKSQTDSENEEIQGINLTSKKMLRKQQKDYIMKSQRWHKTYLPQL